SGCLPVWKDALVEASRKEGLNGAQNRFRHRNRKRIGLRKQAHLASKDVRLVSDRLAVIDLWPCGKLEAARLFISKLHERVCLLYGGEAAFLAHLLLVAERVHQTAFRDEDADLL